jgi:Flp pilus assembly protein TadD
MVRQRQNQKALTRFAAAARLDPANARYSYVYAVALNDSGESIAAIETLERNLSAHPFDRDSLAALVSFCYRAGRSGEALTYARRLDELDRDDPSASR